MEISLGNSLCSYLYLRQAKMPFFLLYLFSLFFYKIRECVVEQVLPKVGGREDEGEW
jgi:hypothetical protein